MFQGTQGVIRLVVSLVAAVLVTVLLCHLKERIDRAPGAELIPLAQVDEQDE